MDSTSSIPMPVEERLNTSAKDPRKPVEDPDKPDKKHHFKFTTNQGFGVFNPIFTLQTFIKFFFRQYKKYIRWTLIVCFLLLYNTYLISACVLNFELVAFLLYITIIIYAILAIKFILKIEKVSLQFKRLSEKIQGFYEMYSTWIQLLSYILSIVTVMLYFALASDLSLNQFRALTGLFIFLLLTFLMSSNAAKIKWKTVFWGIMLQIFLGIMFIRIDIGYAILSWITKEISVIRRYSDFGTSAAFGDYYDKYKTVLKVLPSIIFFIIIFKILQYYNLVQAILVGIGYLSHIIMGTTVCESVYNFLNTFLGWIICCVIIQPYFHLLTNSELHAIITGNFGILSGSIIAAFLDLVFDANHVLAASVISAPASLIVSKILYPETELSSTNIQNIYIIKNKYVHIIDAITDGIEIGLKLYIIAAINLITFTALIAMLDAFLQTLCKLADMEPLSTDVLLAYLFIPFTWLIGIEINDCYNVAHLISLKTIYSEIKAMKILRDLKRTFTLSSRSHCISLYAICSFSNFINMGMQLGSFYIMTPDRYPAITSLIASAFVGGMISSFLTACIAGFVIDDEDIKKSSIHVIG